jgi:hypothetical protein
MKVEKMLITPNVAKGLLEKNTHNRPVRPATVLRYKNDMMEGRWKEDTAELIKISNTDVILDGQHRLLAVVAANKPIHFHVAKNLNDEIFDVLDTGSVRSASDVFKIDSIKNGGALPSIISNYCVLKNGRQSVQGTHANDRMTNSELREFYYEKEKFWQMVANKSQSWYLSYAKIMSKSMIGGLYALFYDISPKDAEAFFEELCTGGGVTNFTIKTLRDKLMADRVGTKKLPQGIKNAMVIKTWNAYRKSTVLRVLKFDSDTESFPTAI